MLEIIFDKDTIRQLKQDNDEIKAELLKKILS